VAITKHARKRPAAFRYPAFSKAAEYFFMTHLAMGCVFGQRVNFYHRTFTNSEQRTLIAYFKQLLWTLQLGRVAVYYLSSEANDYFFNTVLADSSISALTLTDSKVKTNPQYNAHIRFYTSLVLEHASLCPYNHFSPDSPLPKCLCGLAYLSHSRISFVCGVGGYKQPARPPLRF